jgi:CMP-N,N'-diacetyllegionaminic acid synthase
MKEQLLEQNISKGLEILVIIPARGGSKRVPRKNIRDLCGKPLIAYSIEAALNSSLVNRVVVSTEDEEIAQISKDFGADVPFLRPMELAQDNSDVSEVNIYTMYKLIETGYTPNIYITLFPTHPFRHPDLIDFLIRKLISGYSQVRTVKSLTHDPVSLFFKDDDHKLVPCLYSKKNRERSSKTFFRNYGLFVGYNAHISREKIYLHVIKDPVSLIDIDYPADFFLAEEVIKQGCFSK